MTDIYRAPEAMLNEPTGPNEYGSVERAIVGDYDFEIGDVISEAWQKTAGVKWKFQLILLLYFLIYILIILVLGLVFTSLGLRVEDPDLSSMPTVVKLIIDGSAFESLLSSIFILPISAGIFITGIYRAVDKPFSVLIILEYYKKIIPLALTMILLYIMVLIGFILLVLPGIYLAVSYYLAIPLVAEKNMGTWSALETSRKAITKRWFSFFGLLIVLGLINLLAVIPLGIGLIWSIPMSVIALGIVYRNMFGCEPSQEIT